MGDVTLPMEALFPWINGTDTLTDHGDTINVGDIVDVYDVTGHGFNGLESPDLVVEAISGNDLKASGHIMAVEGPGFHRTFKKK